MQPHLAPLADGGFALVWQWSHYNSNVGGQETYAKAQLFDAGAVASSIVYGLGSNAGFETSPDIVSLPEGRLAALWNQYDPATHATHTLTQIFDRRDHAIALTGNALANDYSGTGFNDTMIGMAGPDVLIGDPGRDRLLGGRGGDWVAGGGQADHLSGGPGNDTMWGDLIL